MPLDPAIIGSHSRLAMIRPLWHILDLLLNFITYVLKVINIEHIETNLFNFLLRLIKAEDPKWQNHNMS